MKYTFLTKIIILLFCLGFFYPNLTLAQTNEDSIDYNNLLTDEEAENYSSMSLADITAFLQSKNSYLQYYTYYGYNPAPGEVIYTDDALKLENSRLRNAAEIVYNAAQEARINPKFLLVTLQKEQGLIERSEYNQRALDYAMGYYCFDGQACNPQWQGFGKQVRAAALQFRDYIDNIHTRPYRPGQTSSIDGQAVTPVNRITAAMYVYTPHLHGNRLFMTIWQRYGFGTLNAIIRGILPEGSIVQAKTTAKDSKNEAVYLINNNKKLLFASKNALISRYDPKKVLLVDKAEIDKFADGPEIKFANYSVLEGPDGQRYLLDGLQKRIISSNEVFRQLGYSLDEIIKVSSLDLASLNPGLPLTKENPSPYESLLRDSKSGGVFYIKDGNKYPIIDKSILNINFSNLKIVNATTKALEKYISQTPVLIKDGNLVKLANSPVVYVIAGGQRRPIADEASFVALGYKWSDIKTISERVLILHNLGDPVNL